ncbi:hypothetical protein ACTFIZ_008722 [Dictyostelium cf. discoideum]
MNSSANFTQPNGNVSILNQSPIQHRTNNVSNVSGDESFNNFNQNLDSGVRPTASTTQRIVSRRIPRPIAPPIIQEPENQIIPDPRGPMEYSLDYESLQKFCQKQYYADGNVSPNFIAKIIEQAGGSPYCSKSQNIDSKLKKWVNNKNNNTRTKVADSLTVYSKGYKNYFLKIYLSDNQNFFVNEIYSPNMLSIFLKSINYENYQNDNFIKEFVDSCKTGEEKQWYNDSVPLIKRLISILVDFANAFDSGHKMRKLALSAFQFSHSPLYLNVTESSQ